MATFFSTIPLTTMITIGICGSLQLYVFFFSPPLNQFTLNALLVVYSHQYWRLITSALFHGSVMHIAMNMISFFSIGSALERSIGTVQLLFSIFWQMILTGILHIFISWVLSLVVFNDLSYLKQNSVGFSGVIFALSVLEVSKSGGSSRSLFGMMEVPAKYYPWFLLVILQIMIPNVSFLGHLCGIVVGTAQVHGFHLIPSSEFIRTRIEDVPTIASFIRRETRFVRCPEEHVHEALPWNRLIESWSRKWWSTPPTPIVNGRVGIANIGKSIDPDAENRDIGSASNPEQRHHPVFIL